MQWSASGTRGPRSWRVWQYRMGQSAIWIRGHEWYMVIKVAYQNVGGANKAQGMWLEECQQRGMDIIFMWEVWIPNGKVTTINQKGYELVTEIQKSSRIAAY